MMTKLSHATRVRVLVPILGAVTMLGLLGGTSYAAVDPAVEAAVEGVYADTTSLFTTVVVPVLFALVGIGIAVAIGIKYAKRAKSAV